MIWILIVYLAGFIATLIAVSALSRSVVKYNPKLPDELQRLQSFVHHGEAEWNLPPARCALSALVWPATLALAVYLIARAHLATALPQ